MRVLVCGQRDYPFPMRVRNRIDELNRNCIIIHGACRGADTYASSAAIELGFEQEPYPANWVKYGKAAGVIRNQQMLDTGIDLVLAFAHNIEESKGTKDMIERALKAHIPVEAYE